MNATIRTVIVDDEELARRGLELRLAEHADFALVAQCPNGREAVAAIAREQPDLMFLDIQMPGLSGFDVLARVPQESLPIIVFVTAFDRYALDAFEAHALDYLLKPINEQRFNATIERVRTLWQQRQAFAQREQMMRLLAAHAGAGTLESAADAARDYPEFIAIRDDTGTERVRVGTIDWIDAAGDYMCVHAAGRTYVLRETMKALETTLDPRLFQRVHRSTIVNLKRVRRLRPHTNGEYFLTLLDGQEIKLSRSYRDRVDQLLGKG
ncbi:MAG: LytTR family DNA-binding domain-containing protein [Steroidobacteraceae bacterium]